VLVEELPGRTLLLGALVADLLAQPTNELLTTGAGRP
jgi:glutamate carboxypeptidase